jgi:hypothetical protein
MPKRKKPSRQPNDIGPVYGVPLIDAAPVSEGASLLQAMPGRNELIQCRAAGFERVVAAYEVLLNYYIKNMETASQ